MAGIDKTYTTSYVEYKKLKDWADKQIVTFFDGYTQCIGDYVWSYDKNTFDGREIPVMNTPEWLDMYLIQKCKLEFVLSRMKDVYAEDSYNKAKFVDFKKIPENYKKNRKVKITKTIGITKYPIHNKPYGGYRSWWIQCKDDFNYNDNTKVWSSWDTYYPTYSNTSHIKSLKGVVRHFRKQYLPEGVVFTISGRYVGEEYTATIGN